MRIPEQRAIAGKPDSPMCLCTQCVPQWDALRQHCMRTFGFAFNVLTGCNMQMGCCRLQGSICQTLNPGPVVAGARGSCTLLRPVGGWRSPAAPRRCAARRRDIWRHAMGSWPALMAWCVACRRRMLHLAHSQSRTRTQAINRV